MTFAIYVSLYRIMRALLRRRRARKAVKRFVKTHLAEIKASRKLHSS